MANLDLAHKYKRRTEEIEQAYEKAVSELHNQIEALVAWRFDELEKAAREWVKAEKELNEDAS